MNAAAREAAVKKKTTRMIVLTVVICFASLGTSAFMRSRVVAAAADETKKLEEAKKKVEDAQKTLDKREATEAELARALEETEWTARLAADEEQLASLEAQGYFAILADEFDAELLRSLDDLAERTNVNFVSVRPSKFDHHAPKPRPYELEKDEKKKAELKEDYDKKWPPEKKRPYEKDAAFKTWLSSVEGAADVQEVAITLRGTYGGIFHFVKGLAYTRTGKRFRLLVAVKNVRLTTDASQTINGEPVLTAELFAVTFAVKPKAPEKDKKSDSAAADAGKEGDDAGK